MTAKQISDKAFERLKTFDVRGLLPALRNANQGAIDDVLNTNGNAYYQWGACLVDVVKPKQVVELGGAMGVWAICVLYHLPSDSKLYSITLAEHGLEFSYVVDNYPNLVKIIGDDLDMNNWKGIDLSKTDLWFFDSLHTEKQLRSELKLYSPYFKKGTIILFDDIRQPELWPVWSDLIKDCRDYVELTNPCHYSGYGMVVI